MDSKTKSTTRHETSESFWKQNKRQIRVYAEIGPLTENTWSSTIMHEIHPSFQGDSPLPPQLPCGVPQCTSRSLIVRHTCQRLLAREKRIVEALGQVSPVCISHFPHSPNYASEPTILHRSSKMKGLIGNAFFCDFRSVTARKECEFRIRESRPYNV